MCMEAGFRLDQAATLRGGILCLKPTEDTRQVLISEIDGERTDEKHAS